MPQMDRRLTGVSQAGPEASLLNIAQSFSTQSVSVPAGSAKPTYSALRSNIIKMTPESMQCKLYCKGANCAYCNPVGDMSHQQAIHGLFSSWVTSDILAMARPTLVTIQQYNFIGQFKDLDIKSIINLQCHNEHAFCGPPLLSTGFSYDPELIMRNKIYYYNFAMPDYDIASVPNILNIVKVMWFAQREGRLAVHCHAGLGRTCTLIACYLVWLKAYSADEAIQYVRSKRPKSIQSNKQVMLVEQVASIVQKGGVVLPSHGPYPLNKYLTMQNNFIPSEDVRKYAHIPKVVCILCDRLLRLVFEGHVTYEVESTSPSHNSRFCTTGKILVEWKYAFSAKGRAQSRYIVNLFARLAAFPFEKDETVQTKFQKVSLVGLEDAINDMDTWQLVNLLNYFMELLKKPLADKANIVACFERFAVERQPDTKPRSEVDPLNPLNNKILVKRYDAPWQCLTFFLSNVLSYLTGENYDVVNDLLAMWIYGDIDGDLKMIIHDHMRDLFARNLVDQEEQARELNHNKR